jgi:diaminohydroxyphosphoribosylaminopyrimidine deaminase/5-amino-6-(5-phosphoribosylamino)uracil reductase
MSRIGEERDGRLMAAALSIARRNLGRVWPNPAVGCLVVGEEGGGPSIIARGWTGVGGRPHAETEALGRAGAAARGATCYVTLEPCAHTGLTPPCAEALVRAGVSRVVTAIEDPDPRVGDRGHAMLRAAGIEVATGCRAEAAAELNAGFLTRVRLGRPHVTLKLALSRDGRIAARPGERTRISGEQAERAAHMMRARADAVLIGTGTLRADDPELTCRLPGMADWSPVRVVLDARAEIAPDARLMRTIDLAPVWLVVAERADAARRGALEAAGIRIVEAPEAADGRLDLAAILTGLGDAGITRLMVEAGARLGQSLVRADLVDEAVLFIAPDEIGGGGLAAFPDGGLGVFADDGRFALVGTDALGRDRRHIYRRRQ